ncbi:MAG: LysR family transcriptional regulator [Burkholderiaceae bacterium]|nr:LysR family transcriptional regulator [Burkholderiaceae bacterium]
MNISRLRTLCELATRRTMAAVAEAIFLTPSAVSQQIALLEAEVGVTLIERRGRGVRLTAAGRTLVAHGEQIMSILDEASADLAAIREEISGEIRVAAFPSAAAALLPAAIRSLHEHYPLLEVIFAECGADEGLTALRSWSVDVALTDDLSRVPDDKTKGLEKTFLIEDQLYALVPKDHHLSAEATITLTALKNEMWALESTSSAYAEFVLSKCRSAGFEPRMNGNCRSFEMVAAMVASSCSVSITPGLRTFHLEPEIAVRKLMPEVKRNIFITYRQGERKHPAIQVFVQALLASAAQIRSSS